MKKMKIKLMKKRKIKLMIRHYNIMNKLMIRHYNIMSKKINIMIKKINITIKKINITIKKIEIMKVDIYHFMVVVIWEQCQQIVEWVMNKWDHLEYQQE